MLALVDIYIYDGGVFVFFHRRVGERGREKEVKETD